MAPETFNLTLKFCVKFNKNSNTVFFMFGFEKTYLVVDYDTQKLFVLNFKTISEFNHDSLVLTLL